MTENTSQAVSQTFRAALVQTCTGRDVARNIETVSALVAKAAAAGAHYVQTPEVTVLMTADRDELFARTAPEAGNPALTAFSALARRTSVWLHIGSMAIQTGSGKLANRSFLFGPDGSLAARYDKIHMFDVDISKGDTYWESQRYVAGDRGVVVDHGDHRRTVAAISAARVCVADRA